MCYITNWLYQVLSKQFVGMKLLCTNGLRASLKLLISKPCAKSLLSLTTYKWISQCVALPQLSFFNPFILNRMSDFYQLDESISNLRVATGLSAVCDCGISCSYSLTIFVWWYLSFLFKFKTNFCKQTMENLIRSPHLAVSDLVCTVCRCPTERTLC